MSSTASEACGYKFITELADDLKCLFCSEVAKEPLQHVACGTLFCKECIETHGKDKPCLHCEEKDPLFYQDGKARRAIQSLRVKCTKMTDGTSCTWEGPFATLEMHVDMCKFVPVTCPRQCKELLVKKNLTEHLKKYCPYRVWECGLCGETGRYSDITPVHRQVCPMETLECPIAGCIEVMQRQHIAGHLATCERALVSCKYRNIGCEAKLKRMDVSKHEENVEAHLCMAILELQDSNSSLKSNSAQLVRAVARADGSLEALKNKATDLMECSRQDIERLEVLIILGNHESTTLGMQVQSLLFSKSKACTFRMTNCQNYIESGRVFTSRPFYTTPGYRSYHMVVKVQLKSGAHPNYVSIQAALVGGKFDQELSWPFVRELEVLLLNQQCNAYHHHKTLSIRAEDDMRVGSPPKGLADFISHHDLYHNPDPEITTRQYLKDDTLYFQVSMNQPKSWLSCSE